MKRFARLLMVTFGFGVLGFAMSLVPQKNATGAPGVGGAPVTVNNTAANPVPVTGNVNASVSGSVGITGTPKVTVSNFPAFPATLTGSSVPVSVSFPSSIGVTGGPVNVSNVLDANSNPVPLVVRDADNPARQPFFACSPVLSTDAVTSFYTVPSGKRAVVETVEVLPVGGTVLTPRLFFTVGGTAASFDYLVNTQAQPTKFYIDPDTNLSVGMDLPSGGSGQVCALGYLVDLN